MSLPEIVVTHVTSKDDFHGLMEVEESAFGPSPVMELWYPPSSGPKPEGPNKQNILNHQRVWSTDPTAHYLKATLPDGKIVGMAKWNFILDSTEPLNVFDMELPAEANRAFAEYFLGGLMKARTAHMGDKHHFLMEILCVSPQYQRMGVGDKLLKWGLSEADRLGLECWIDASPFGLGLYKKLGWEEVGFTDIDLAKWGGKKDQEPARTVHMVRQPRAITVS